MARGAILVVDDERDIRELLDYNLRKEGYDVACVSTGEDALASVRARRPDLVVLDLMLPGVDGLEVCRRLQADAGHARRPDRHAHGQGRRGRRGHRARARRRRLHHQAVQPARAARPRPRRPASRDRGRCPTRRSRSPSARSSSTPAVTRSASTATPVDLTASEFRIMHLMARRPGWVFTRQQLVEAVQGDDVFVERALRHRALRRRAHRLAAPQARRRRRRRSRPSAASAIA